MKFTNYKNMMTAATGLIQSGWTLDRFELDGREVTTITLYHEAFELFYTLEHHKNEETYNASSLRPFSRSRKAGPIMLYGREHPLSIDLNISNQTDTPEE